MAPGRYIFGFWFTVRAAYESGIVTLSALVLSLLPVNDFGTKTQVSTARPDLTLRPPSNEEQVADVEKRAA